MTGLLCSSRKAYLDVFRSGLAFAVDGTVGAAVSELRDGFPVRGGAERRVADSGPGFLAFAVDDARRALGGIFPMYPQSPPLGGFQYICVGTAYHIQTNLSYCCVEWEMTFDRYGAIASIQSVAIFLYQFTDKRKSMALTSPHTAV